MNYFHLSINFIIFLVYMVLCMEGRGIVKKSAATQQIVLSPMFVDGNFSFSCIRWLCNDITVNVKFQRCCEYARETQNISCYSEQQLCIISANLLTWLIHVCNQSVHSLVAAATFDVFQLFQYTFICLSMGPFNYYVRINWVVF